MQGDGDSSAFEVVTTPDWFQLLARHAPEADRQPRCVYITFPLRASPDLSPWNIISTLRFHTAGTFALYYAFCPFSCLPRSACLLCFLLVLAY